MAFAWSDAYSVGDAELDRQHQGLVAILDRLAGEVEGGGNAGDRGAERLFDELALYVMSHFAYEEQRMADGGYPIDRLSAHRQSHRTLIRQVQDMQARIAAGEAVLGDLVPFLYGDWLLKHICTEDHDYMPYLQARA